MLTSAAALPHLRRQLAHSARWGPASARGEPPRGCVQLDQSRLNFGNASCTAAGVREWIHDRSLTIVMLGLFAIFTVGQFLTGLHEHNAELVAHGRSAITLWAYFENGHLWEALFENWESEFLQMAAFVTLTTIFYQVGSPESRRPRVAEAVDADPRRFAHLPDVPWPVKRGGWILRVYENSLGLALFLLFLVSGIGHALGGFKAFAADQALHGEPPPSFVDYVTSSRFWFESFQNWQSEFLSVGVMVWLSVYLRQRYSPESKAVHAPHSESGH